MKLSAHGCFGVVFTIIVIASAATSEAADFVPHWCEQPNNFVEFRFELKNATKDGRGDFIGEFEIENIRFGKDVVLEGELRDGVFHIDYPEVWIEFMDLNGSWTPLMLHPPGDFFGPHDARTLAPGAKTSFVTPLPPSERVDLGGHKFRLLLTARSQVCIESEPFVVVQQRGPITGFKSAGRSNNALKSDARRTRAP